MFAKWHGATYRFLPLLRFHAYSYLVQTTTTALAISIALGMNTFMPTYPLRTQTRSSRLNFLFLHVNSTHLKDDSHAAGEPTFQLRCIESTISAIREDYTHTIINMVHIIRVIPITCNALACVRHVPTCRNRPCSIFLTYPIRIVLVAPCLDIR